MQDSVNSMQVLLLIVSFSLFSQNKNGVISASFKGIVSF